MYMQLQKRGKVCKLVIVKHMIVHYRFVAYNKGSKRYQIPHTLDTEVEQFQI
jgi:hypothetical protein